MKKKAGSKKEKTIIPGMRFSERGEWSVRDSAPVTPPTPYRRSIPILAELIFNQESRSRRIHIPVRTREAVYHTWRSSIHHPNYQKGP